MTRETSCKKMSIAVLDRKVSIVTDFLFGIGAEAVTENEPGDGAQKDSQAGTVKIEAYFPLNSDDNDISAMLTSFIENSFSPEEQKYFDLFGLETLEEGSWDNWKEGLKPVRAGGRFIITPPWETPETNEGDIVVIINPSMAFGTGHHETTQLCLELIEEVAAEMKIKSMLDVGFGSGILSIAASKIGIETIKGIDIDPVAVQEAYKNIELNGIERNLDLKAGTINDIQGKFGLIAANIQADVILSIANIVQDRLTPDGIFIASGILKAQADEVVTGLNKAGFKVVKTIFNGDWMALEAVIDNSSV